MKNKASMSSFRTFPVSKFAEVVRIDTYDDFGVVWTRCTDDHSIFTVTSYHKQSTYNASLQDAINEATGSILDTLYA